MIFRSHASHTAAWRRMLSPLRYLFIRHGAKRAFDFGWPAALSIVTIAIFIVLPVRPPILGDQGFLKSLHDLIGLLAAFFVAALAAVSTVDRKTLDIPMLGAPPILDRKPLSRRSFICMLFGYLSFVAFALFLGSVLAEFIAPSLRVSVNARTLDILRLFLGLVYAAVFWNMVCTTLLGIWFLVERVPMTAIETADSSLVQGLTIPGSTWRLQPQIEPADQKD